MDSLSFESTVSFVAGQGVASPVTTQTSDTVLFILALIITALSFLLFSVVYMSDDSFYNFFKNHRNDLKSSIITTFASKFTQVQAIGHILNFIRAMLVSLIAVFLIYLITLCISNPILAFGDSSIQSGFPGSVKATVNANPDSITIENATLTNNTGKRLAYKSATASQTENASGASGLSLCTLKVVNGNCVLYDETPSPYGASPLEYSSFDQLSILEPNQAIELNFSIEGLNVNDAQNLIGKDVFKLTFNFEEQSQNEMVSNDQSQSSKNLYSSLQDISDYKVLINGMIGYKTKLTGAPWHEESITRDVPVFLEYEYDGKWVKKETKTGSSSTTAGIFSFSNIDNVFELSNSSSNFSNDDKSHKYFLTFSCRGYYKYRYEITVDDATKDDEAKTLTVSVNLEAEQDPCLDAYTLEELSSVSEDIREKRYYDTDLQAWVSASDFYGEFLEYLHPSYRKSPTDPLHEPYVWYSHSITGYEKAQTDDERLKSLDIHYLNNFVEGGEKNINNYVFLRIIDVIHDDWVDNREIILGKAGLTVQTVHCLPVLSSMSQQSDAWWQTSNARKQLNEKSGNTILRKFNGCFYDNSLNVRKTSQTIHDPKALPQTTDDRLFLPSYSEVCAKNPSTSGGSWYGDNTEGDLYAWYSYADVSGTGPNQNSELINLGFLNDGTSLDLGYTYPWLRTVCSYDENGFQVIDPEGCIDSTSYCAMENGVCPCFCLGNQDNTMHTISGKVTLNTTGVAHGSSPEGTYVKFVVKSEESVTEFYSSPVDSEGNYTISNFKTTQAGTIVYNQDGYYGVVENVVPKSSSTTIVNISPIGPALDNYTFEELKKVGDDLSDKYDPYQVNVDGNGISSSKYYNEFLEYCKNGDVWHSHSCGKYDQATTVSEQVAAMDSNYETWSGSQDVEVRQDYFFHLRILGLLHDDAVDENNMYAGKAGLTFQNCSALRDTFSMYDRGSTSSSEGWIESNVKKQINEHKQGEAKNLYDNFSDAIKDNVQKVRKKVAKPNKNNIEGSYVDDINSFFILSASEMSNNGYNEIYPIETKSLNEGFPYAAYLYDQTYSGRRYYGTDVLTPYSNYNVPHLYNQQFTKSGIRFSPEVWTRSSSFGYLPENYTDHFVTLNNSYITSSDSVLDGWDSNFNSASRGDRKNNIVPCFCVGSSTNSKQGNEEKFTALGSISFATLGYAHNLIPNYSADGYASSYELKDMNVRFITREGVVYQGSYFVTPTDLVDKDFNKLKLKFMYIIPEIVKNSTGYIILEKEGWRGVVEINNKVQSNFIKNVNMSECMLDCYTLEEISSVAKDLKANKTLSKFYSEFSYFINTGQIWYSHSGGLYNPNDPSDTSWLDKNYKNNFPVSSNNPNKESADVNQYLFLRILGINQDNCQDNTTAGLTLQAVHALPKLFTYDTVATSSRNWQNSALRKTLNDDYGQIYMGLNDNFKKLITPVVKNTQDVSGTGSHIGSTIDKLFILSYAEMCASDFVSGRPAWYHDEVSNGVYSWYQNMNIRGTGNNDALNSFCTCNNGYKFERSWSPVWQRSLYYNNITDFLTISSVGNLSTYARYGDVNCVVLSFCL